jgi:hypothetical protein
VRRLALVAACGLALCAAPAQANPLLGIHGDLPRFQELTGQASTVHQAFLAWGQGQSFGAPFTNLFSTMTPIPMIHLGTSKKPPANCEAITPAAIASGVGDDYLRALNAGISEWGQAIYVRPMGEMNNDINCYAGFREDGSAKSGHSPTSYRLAFARIYLILHGGKAAAVNAILRSLGLPPVSGDDLAVNPFPRLRVVWSPLAGGSPRIPANAPQMYYPGTRFVDVDGADIFDDTMTDTAPWSDLEAIYRASVGHRKPFAVPEWGLLPDDDVFVNHMCKWLVSHPSTEEVGFYESRRGSAYDIQPKSTSRDAYSGCISPMGAPLPRWATGGGTQALQPSVAFLVLGKAKPGIDAPGGANDLDVNFDPHTGVLGSAFWLRGSPLDRVTPMPPRATGFVFTTKGGASPAPLAPPAGATGIHVEWDPVTGKLKKAAWYRVGSLLAVIPLARGQTALAVSG